MKGKKNEAPAYTGVKQFNEILDLESEPEKSFYGQNSNKLAD